MATNDKDINELISITESNLSLGGRCKEKRRCRNELNTPVTNSSKLQKDEYLDEKIDRLISNTTDSLNVSKFLYSDILQPSPDDDDNSDEYSENYILPEDKSCINLLLEKREDLTETVCKILEENRELEEQISMKKMQLKNSTEERNEVWNKAVQVLKSLTLKLKVSYKTDCSSEDSSIVSSLSIEDSAKHTYKMKMKEKIEEKYKLIQDLSGVLHKLISFSDIYWANNNNLLNIVLCTGKILNTPFNENNPRAFENFLMDCVLRLNDMKWELL